MRINLLPEEYRPKPPMTFLSFILVLFSGLIIFGAVVFALVEYYNYRILDSKLLVLTQKNILYSVKAKEVSSNEKFNQDIKIFKEEITGINKFYYPYMEILNKVTSSLPADLWLIEINIPTNSIIKIKGGSIAISFIGILKDNLDNLHYFKNVKIIDIKLEGNEKSGQYFTFNAEIDLGRGPLEYAER